MQHHGWLETLLVSRFADRELVFRNLGFSGDEINLGLRLRMSPLGRLRFGRLDKKRRPLA